MQNTQLTNFPPAASDGASRRLGLEQHNENGMLGKQPNHCSAAAAAADAAGAGASHAESVLGHAGPAVQGSPLSVQLCARHGVCVGEGAVLCDPGKQDRSSQDLQTERHSRTRGVGRYRAT